MTSLIDGRFIPPPDAGLSSKVPWILLDQALAAGSRAFEACSGSVEDRALFLDELARLIDRNADRLALIAHEETALPAAPRFKDVEIPRTTDQLRQAARAVRSRSWRDPVINRSAGVARIRETLPGIVFVLGPNNFPFAFNGIGGGDFAAAIGAGNPVVAKANPGHVRTTVELARLANEALATTDLPAATVQMVVDVDPEDGLRLVGDSRVAATAFTGSRHAGIALKTAADSAGKPIYLEMSSINPLVVLEGACLDSESVVAGDVASSITVGSGQFCTKPGLVFVPLSQWEDFKSSLTRELGQRNVHPLLSDRTLTDLREVTKRATEAGAEVAIEIPVGSDPPSFPTTVLLVGSDQFKDNPEAFTAEAFGNSTTVVTWKDGADLLACIALLEGTLAASLYFGSGDGPLAHEVIAALRRRAGRITTNKPPTGVQVVEAMNHGGPFPATGHPGFTAVGIPESFKRFTMLVCYDGVPDDLMPSELQAANPLGIARLELE